MDIAHKIDSRLRVLGISEKDFHIIEYDGGCSLLHIPNSMLFEIDDLARDRILAETLKKPGIKKEFLSKYSKKQISQVEKELKSLLKAKTAKEKKVHTIDTVSLNVARSCNLTCGYCYTVDGSYGLGELLMSEETAYKTIDFFLKGKRSGSNFYIHFTGGEPLLNFELIEKVVGYAKKIKRKRKINFFFSISTNGTLFDIRIVRFFKKNKFDVIVSIDANRAVHNRNRIYKNGSGSYADVVKGTKLFRQIKGKLTLTCSVTVTDESLDFVKTFKSLKKMGFNKIHFTYANVFKKDKRALKTGWEAMTKGIDSLFKEALRDIRRGGKNLTAYSNFNHILELLALRKKVFYPCSAGRSYLMVDADSNFYFCHRFTGEKDFSLGSIKSSKTARKDRSVDENALCSKCWARYLCGGGCYYDNYYCCGDVKKQINGYCSYIKDLIEKAVLLYIECRRKKILHKVFKWSYKPYKEKK